MIASLKIFQQFEKYILYQIYTNDLLKYTALFFLYYKIIFIDIQLSKYFHQDLNQQINDGETRYVILENCLRMITQIFIIFVFVWSFLILFHKYLFFYVTIIYSQVYKKFDLSLSFNIQLNRQRLMSNFYPLICENCLHKIACVLLILGH